ncbi:MAG: hypothetical protein Fur005_20660 [Roseiflexaceae bacterium]
MSFLAQGSAPCANECALHGYLPFHVSKSGRIALYRQLVLMECEDFRNRSDCYIMRARIVPRR